MTSRLFLLSEKQGLTLDPGRLTDEILRGCSTVDDKACLDTLLNSTAVELCYEYLFICTDICVENGSTVYYGMFGPSIIQEKIGVVHQHLEEALKEDSLGECIPFDESQIEDSVPLACEIRITESDMEQLKKQSNTTKLRRTDTGRCGYTIKQQ